MATLLTIPANPLVAPSSWGSRDSIKKTLEKIKEKYMTYLTFASEQSGIPVEVIASFIAVESGGNASAGTSGHVTQGLMQWNRTYAKSNLEKECSEGRLNENEISKLAEYGITFTKCVTRDITNADQLKPELNILIGTIILGQKIDTDWGTEDGEMKLDRVIAVYNAGAYGNTGKLARSKKYKTPASLVAVVNSITAGYIKKMLGSNGALDIAFTDKIFTV
jgi:soluble lytic murein transglycosylase-like protein